MDVSNVIIFLFLILPFVFTSSVSAQDIPQFECRYDSFVDACKPVTECPPNYKVDPFACRTRCFDRSEDHFNVDCMAPTPTPEPISDCSGACLPDGSACYRSSGEYCSGTKFCCVQQLEADPTPIISPTPISSSLPSLPPTPIPTNVAQKCQPDFHPLRPYPGCPVDRRVPEQPNDWPEKLVSFECGKSLNPEASVSVPVDGPRCPDNPALVCYKKNIDFDITIDLTQARIPILGNTEDPNLTDAEKVNNYLSWYLNGTVQQSEQEPLDSNPEAMDRLINFSGPLKKLLPYDAQQALRRTLVTHPALGQENYLDGFHDYLVGCQKDLDIKYLADLFTKAIPATLHGVNFSAATLWNLGVFFFNNPNKWFDATYAIGTAIDGNFSEAIKLFPAELVAEFQEIYRTSESAFRAFAIAINTVSFNLAESCTTSLNKKYLSNFKSHLPPNPSADKYKADPAAYQRDLRDWYGFLRFGPFVDKTSGVWAQLFQNIPFSTLEDVAGEVTIALYPNITPDHPNYGKSPINLTITGPGYTADPGGRIYVPHVKNINALAEILAKMVRPAPGIDLQDNKNLAAPYYEAQPRGDKVKITNLKGNNSTMVAGLINPPPVFVGHDDRCDLKNFRATPDGDKLFGDQITAHLTYAQTFRYQPRNLQGLPEGAVCQDPDQCQSGRCTMINNVRRCERPPNLEHPTEARVAVFTKTPLIDRIYDSLVAGDQSLLHRFLPGGFQARQGRGAFSGASAVGYDAQTFTGGTKDAHASAGDKTGGAQIFFARLGSLFDYILGGATAENFNLQKILRPKLTSSQTTPGSCTLDSTTIQTAIAQVTAKYNLPTGLLQAVYEIEALPFIADPGKYVCQRHPSGSTAVGIMQIIDATYKDITCESERYTDDVGICPAEVGKLSRCSLSDSVELAARVLLSKVGQWNSSTCQARGEIKSKDDIYKAVNNYYGSCSPDEFTRQYSYNLPNSKRPSGDNYGDIVLNKMNRLPYLEPQCL